MIGQAEQGGGVHDHRHLPTRHSRGCRQVPGVVGALGGLARAAARWPPEEEVGEHVRAALIQAPPAVLLGMGVVRIIRLGR